MNSHDDDFEAAGTPPLLRIAGGFGLLAGSIIMLTSIQTLTGFILVGFFAYAPYLLLIVGGALAYAGVTLMRARSAGAILQIALSGVAIFFSGSWLLLSLSRGLISLFGLASPILSVMSLGLAIVSLGPCERVNAARKRLAEKGLDLGV